MGESVYMITQQQAMDIWSLKREGFSQRQIARKLGLSRNTIAKFLKKGNVKPYDTSQRTSGLEPWHDALRTKLEEEDYTATRLHRWVRAQGYTGSYETVKRFVSKEKSAKERLAYLRFETEPGLQAQVDFSEFRVRKTNGEEQKYYLFVLVLGYSRQMYAELVPNQCLRTFLDCHQRAFAWLGGVPVECVYDNLKNVVVRRLVGQIDWNTTMLDFAHHYGFRLVACPPYAPWCKGKVERPIGYLNADFWRGYVFSSLTQANADLWHWLTEVAAQRVHGTTREVVGVRFAREKPSLGPLPAQSYDTREKVVRKVYRDCQVSFGGNRYVVPHRWVGKKLLVCSDGQQLTVYHDAESIVTYPLATGRGELVQNPAFYKALKEDLRQNHRKFSYAKGKARQAPEAWTQPVEHRPLDWYQHAIEGDICPN